MSTTPAAATKRQPSSKVPVLSQEAFKHLVQSGEHGELLEQRYMVTPAIAKRILAKHNHQNRSINEVHLQSLIRDIKNNNWIAATGTMVSFAQNGQLIDGQHRLSAIVKSKTPLPLSLKFGLDEKAQRVIDTGRKRTYGDFIAMTEGLDAKYKTERASVTRLLYGFLHDQYYPHAFATNTKPTQSDLYAISEEFGEDISEAVQTVLGPGQVQRVVIGSYAALVYLLAAASDYGDHAKEFFKLLGSGANLEADDPIMVTRNRLMTREDFRAAKNKDRTIGLLVKAWNLWVAGKSVSSKMHNTDEVPPVAGLKKLGRHRLYR